MSAEVKPYLHTQTGKVALLTEDAASVFPNYLIEVPEGTADLEPGLFKPGTVDEFKARQTKGARYQTADEIAAEDNAATDTQKAE